MGQFNLHWNSRENEEVLKDPKVSKLDKEKIKKVLIYKKYFYKYFTRKASDIYTQTMILDQKAVTYLVIASPYYVVKPKKYYFPFYGSFPYLGFFKKSSAIEFKKGLEEEGYSTYMRPVYAYSTLGSLEDRILSSFFYYSKDGLAELVFHELFHTVFFINDEVGLNEALANYFGKEMMAEYFEYSPEKFKAHKKDKAKNRAIGSLIVKLSKDLNKLYLDAKVKDNRDAAKLVFDNFMKNRFYKDIRKLCADMNIKDKRCYPLKGEWNNARLAAFGTYQNSMEQIEKLRIKHKLNLKQFLSFIEKKYKSYEDQSKVKKFKNYLFEDVQL
jgi:predicted aminopeptidase